MKRYCLTKACKRDFVRLYCVVAEKEVMIAKEEALKTANEWKAKFEALEKDLQAKKV